MDPLREDAGMRTAPSYLTFNPVSYVLVFLASYGWYLVGAAALTLYAVQRLKPYYRQWVDARDEAAYHKDPDVVLARMEAIQRARERQQERLDEESRKAAELQKEREEKKRRENLERLEKYGTAAGGKRLGTGDDGYLPLSGGASTSTYRAPKRSACKGGGCGK